MTKVFFNIPDEIFIFCTKNMTWIFKFAWFWRIPFLFLYAFVFISKNSMLLFG